MKISWTVPAWPGAKTSPRVATASNWPIRSPTPRFDIVAENFKAGALTRMGLGYADINAVQALLLFNIGDKELTAGELRTRGYYLGSNVSYNLKKLVEMGYLHHARSRVDRRSVRISLTDTEPKISWKVQNASEYGFYSNVNPDRPHPRWSQASERRIGELGRRPTLMFNGYAEEVASLYEGMDLIENY